MAKKRKTASKKTTPAKSGRPESFRLRGVRIKYPNLSEASTIPGYEQNAPKFRATFIIDAADPDVAAFMRHCEELCLAEFEGDLPEGNRWPFSDASEYYGEGKWEVKTSASEKFPPVVCDQELNALEGEAIEQIQGGDYVNANVGLYAYVKGGIGLMVNLNAVQFVAKGEPIGRSTRPSNLFDAIPIADESNRLAVKVEPDTDDDDDDDDETSVASFFGA